MTKQLKKLILFRLIILTIQFKNLFTRQKNLENQKEIPIRDKYITFNNFDKFPVAIFDERLKQAKVATINDLDSVESCAI